MSFCHGRFEIIVRSLSNPPSTFPLRLGGIPFFHIDRTVFPYRLCGGRARGSQDIVFTSSELHFEARDKRVLDQEVPERYLVDMEAEGFVC